MHNAKSVIFPLSRTCTGTCRNPKAGGATNVLAHRLRRALGAAGYSIDSLQNTPPPPLARLQHSRDVFDPHPAETYISRVIPEPHLSNLHGILSDTGILHIKNLLRPCGLRLRGWTDFYINARILRQHRWTHIGGRRDRCLVGTVLKAAAPTWWAKLEDELLESKESLRALRMVKQIYQDAPCPHQEEMAMETERQWLVAPTTGYLYL
jgi:hypothetical protein